MGISNRHILVPYPTTTRVLIENYPTTGVNNQPINRQSLGKIIAPTYFEEIGCWLLGVFFCYFGFTDPRTTLDMPYPIPEGARFS